MCTPQSVWSKEVQLECRGILPCSMGRTLMSGTIGGCHRSGHTRLREHKWVLTMTMCTLQLFLSKESAFFARSYSTSSRGSISEDHVSACMTCNNCSSKFCITCINELVDSIEGFDSIPRTVKRCDATYRKIMGMDTVHVNPAIVPVKGDSTERQRPTTMQSSQIDDERDDCGVPRSRTYSPERARIGTDTVRLYPAIVPVKGDSTKRPRPCNVCRSTMRGTITR